MSEKLNKEDQEFYDSLTKADLEELEVLAKKCPRCGGASANSSNSAGRCSSCLKKLRTNKKKPGNYLHNHKVADDALRRQKGKNGTAPGTSKGNASRKEIIDKVKREEKKTGTVVSLDRKDNDKGYSAENTRAAPKHLNRGRHNIDKKKLAAWRRKLKKSEISTEQFLTMLLAKAAQLDDQTVYEALEKVITDMEN